MRRNGRLDAGRWITRVFNFIPIASCGAMRYLRALLLDNPTCRLCASTRSAEMLLHLKQRARKYNQGKSQLPSGWSRPISTASTKGGEI